jgi:hypothetical protein
MPIARADREPEPPIKLGRSVEIAHGMDNVIESARHESHSQNSAAIQHAGAASI